MNFKYFLCAGVVAGGMSCCSVYAEFNLIQVDENPDFIELGYRNTISDKFTRIITGKIIIQVIIILELGGVTMKYHFMRFKKMTIN